MINLDWRKASTLIEQQFRQDPSRRGMASYRSEDEGPLGEGEVRDAAADIASRATRVGILTGFCVTGIDRPAAETDGPPGSLYLARALLELGIEVVLISDRYGLPLLEVGCDFFQLGRGLLSEIPLEQAAAEQNPQPNRLSRDGDPSEQWIDDFFSTGAGQGLSHLIAIERVGPSYTPEALRAEGASDEMIARFERSVPPDHQDVCHNARGLSIDRQTAQSHQLFETIAKRALPIRTIGIGDGGNEIGMGSFGWSTLTKAIQGDKAARIACRIATDFALVGGVSDWAAYGLAIGVCVAAGKTTIAKDWDVIGQQRLIEAIVQKTDAVDGITGRRAATVDGLPMSKYLAPLRNMREIVGFGAA